MEQYFTDINNVFGNAIECGIKKNGLDLAYIYVPTAVASATVFTQHKFKASSVTYTQKNSKRHTLKACIINSGNANAVTGKKGDQDTKQLASLTASYLNLTPKEVGVAATGIIGVNLPMDVITKSMPTLFSNTNQKAGKLVAKAILTTDLVEKTVWVEKKIGKKNIIISGITKGSGMIAPNMATTLTFLVTNINIDQKRLQQCLEIAVNKSFNMMSVDTDTSTNDMVICFATGQHSIAQHDKTQCDEFQACLDDACLQLAIKIAKDGEGASKLIKVDITSATTHSDAKKIAKSVIESPLVKTAIHGADPNWGRILMAMGKIPQVKLNPLKVTVSIGPHILVKNGLPTTINRSDVKKELENQEVSIIIDLGIGNASASAWGCDLTKGYIDINTDYN